MREGDTVNVFDRAVAAVAPVHAAKRAAARAALKIIDSGYGNYGANLTKKSLRGWEFYGGSAKEDIEDNIDILRQRSRDAYMGIPTASAALKTMDLAKKTYSTTPDYFIAGTTVGIVTAAKEASAAIAAHNLVLLDGGKVKPLAAVDGSNALNVTGLYGIAAENAASGEDAVVYLTGEFFAEGLALPDGVAAADIEVALRNIGIFLK